jgi:CRP/FNR family transcriptional regulator, cyclic AMP receptor protein
MTNRIWLVSAPGPRAARAGLPVRAPYGLEIIESCLECPHRKGRLFCDLPAAAVQRLASITAPSTYPKGATLFVEGQDPRGVFVLCEGKVKLSTSSSDGKTLILRISDAGEVLGLAAVISGRPYHATATVLEPAQANFISKNDFLNFLSECGEAALRASQQIGGNYQLALAEMRTIGLSHSATEKLARFVLDWCAEHDTGNGQVRANLTLTHEEIAQIIGSSRETVTRLLSNFRTKNLLQTKGHILIIRDRPGLENLVADDLG